MKRLQRLIGMVSLLAVLLWCISCAVEEPVEEPEPEREEITFWHCWDMSNCQKELGELVEGFNAAQSQITVQLQYVPEEDFRKQLALSMAEDTMPDIALVSSSDFSFFHHMRPFVRLDGQIEGLEQYMPKMLELCTVEGGVYGLPFDISCTALFYNQDMLTEAGAAPPRTWEEFEEAAVRVSGNGCAGLGISAGINEGSTYIFLPILWSMGADPLHIDSEEGRQAYGMIARLASQGAVSRQGTNMTMTDTTRQFARQEAAMIFFNSTGIAEIQGMEGGLNFGVAAVPEGKELASIMGGEILAVTPGGNEEASVQFLRYLSDPDRMGNYLGDMGLMAPREDVLQAQYREQEELRIFIDSLPYARLRPEEAWWPEASDQIARALRRVVAGEEVSQVLLEAQQEIDKILLEEQDGEAKTGKEMDLFSGSDGL